MKSPFSFDGELDRPRYAAASLATFFIQHAFVLIAFLSSGPPLRLSWWFWFNPLRQLVAPGMDILNGHYRPPSILLLAIAVVLIVDWLLVAFAFRRIRHMHGDQVFAGFAVVPVVQVAVILWLSMDPRSWQTAPAAPRTETPNRRNVVLGLLVGATLSVLAVAFSTLVLHLYGYGLFVASPFVISLATGYLLNRNAELGKGSTVWLVFVGLALGALALIGFAFEGAICLIMAAPLIAAMGIIGALSGRALARRRRHRSALLSIAVAPLLLAAEIVLPPHASFESIESIEVAAPPAAVWDAVVHMGPISDAPAAPFRWGLAYPMRGEIQGQGVGAVRRGVFSTGVAYERVTEWEPGRQLSFIVLSDPPTMRELSPYQHVNAPHVSGYFRTLDARFTITPLANGKTRLSLATQHDLDLEPALYWLPLAQWAVHANKVRVLQHFRQQAESTGQSG